jgi:hypothetical protein
MNLDGASLFEGGIAAERRREKRYPIPEIYQTFIRMESAARR